MDCPAEICIIRTAGILLTVSSLIAGIYYLGLFRSLSNIQTTSVKTEDEIFYCIQGRNLISGYQCVNNHCEKTVSNSGGSNAVNSTCLTSLNVCQLLCGRSDFLWPVPTKNVTMSNNLTAIDPKKVYFKNDIPGNSKKLSGLLENLKAYFVDISTTNPSKPNSNLKNIRNIFVTFKCKTDSITLDEQTDESYELKLETKNDRVSVLINASTYFGVRHGLETLSQLILFDDVSNATVMPKEGFIADEPAYRYRGIMLDTGRNYYSVQSIKRTLDAMAMNKMNAFHWHIVGPASFPFVSKKHPDMSSVGAFSSDQIYTKDDVKDIRKYAKVRGIRIIPELDVPARVGEGWQHLNDSKTGDNFMLCYTTELQRSTVDGHHYRRKLLEPNGQLNPTLDEVYELLSDLYKEMTDWFETNLFHIGGGTNVDLDCWNTTEINRWISKHKTVKNITQLEDYFYMKVIDKLKAADKNVRLIARDGSLTKSAYLDKLDKDKFIFQIQNVGNNTDVGSVLQKGYNVIISNDDILNLSGEYNPAAVPPPVVNSTTVAEVYDDKNSRYKKIYYNDPLQLIKNVTLNTIPESKLKKQILGAEVELWSDGVDGNTVDAILWPSCSVFGERLWSDSSMDWTDAKNRLLFHRQRMTLRNISADALESVWCLQHPSKCQR